MQRLAAISVDLDSLVHYCRIHALPESLLGDAQRTLVARVAIPRLLELFDGRPATFFVIGSEVDGEGMAAALAAAHRAGVELASHSFSHDYALARRPLAEIDHDLALAHEAIARLGVEPRGFRAPGYTLSPALLQAVAARSYAYDSSVFPATPYYLAKAGVMGALRLLGRPSRAILDSPRVLLAPRTPYRPSLSAPYHEGAAAFVELPMAVAPVTRLPFIGTFISSLPWPLVEAAFYSLRGDSFFNLELHAADVLDESDGIPAALVARQRDFAVPVREKLKRLRTVFGWLDDDRTRVTVLDAARAWR